MAKQLRLDVAQLTDVGRKRDHNEDNMAYVIPSDVEVMAKKGALFIVADGMGGHAAGEIASEIAVDTVSDAYYQDDSDDVTVSLVHAIKGANVSIHQRAAENMLRSGMGTTCVAAVLRGDMAYIANVGDSRAYLVRGGNVRQVSQDHSWVAEQVRAGLLTEDQARTHAQRNVITRCLGTQSDVEIDIFAERLEEGDSLVLCTDGLSGLISDEDLRRIVSQFVPQESVYHLVERANENGGPDNITAIVVHVQEVGSEPNGRRPVYIGGRETSEDARALGGATTVPLLAPQASSSRSSGPLRAPSGPLATTSTSIPASADSDTAPQPVVKAQPRGRRRLLYPTVALLILLLLALVGGGGYYVLGTMSLQHIRALIVQAQAEVRSNNPSQALQHLASAQNLLQALPADPFLRTERTQVTQQLTTTVKQAIQSYDQQATITPLCPAITPTAPINDGSTGTHAQRLALVQAGTGPALLYALGKDGKVYQLNSQNSLANPTAASNLHVQDIAGDDARLAVLVKVGTTNNYFLDLLVPGQAGQPHVTDLASISPVNGEIPILVTAQGTDVYVVLASPPAATTGQVQAHIIDFMVGPGNTLTPNPLRTSFTFSGTLVSAAAFPGHLLFLLLADSSGHGSLTSLQVTGKGTPLVPAPVLVPSLLALPLAVSSAAFTPTTPVPVPAASTAVPPTGPLPLQLSSTGVLAAGVVGNVPHLYIADTAHNRVLDLSEVGTGGGVTGSGSNNVTLQLVQQYASSSILVQMTSMVVDSKGMVVYVLTQSKSNPPIFNLVSINQAGSSCA